MNTQDRQSGDPDLMAINEAIDLLVLNELPVPEQDDLIRRLDEMAGGWKRCAIAFIEDQRLGNALRSAVCEKEPVKNRLAVGTEQPGMPLGLLLAVGDNSARVGLPGERQGKKTGRGSVRRSRRPVHLLWAMAATLTLVSGFLFGRLEVGNYAGGQSPQNTVPGGEPVSGAVAGVAVPNGETLSGLLNDEAMRQIAYAHSALEQEDFQIVAMLQTTSNAGEKFLPIVASSSLQEKLGSLPSPTLSHAFTSRLKREGWHVDACRQLVSMKSPDGKYSLTPLDLFHCRFVGKATY